MRICKRCKTNEATKGSLNCEKCDERNRKHTAKLIAVCEVKIISKGVDCAYGGLGNEWEKGVAGHLENL
jgi:hypothetical protein